MISFNIIISVILGRTHGCLVWRMNMNAIVELDMKKLGFVLEWKFMARVELNSVINTQVRVFVFLMDASKINYHNCHWF